MRANLLLFPAAGLALLAAVSPRPTASQEAKEDSVQVLVGRLSLDHYKTTIKGLTQFGDRRQGTQRNRKTVDWINAQLKAAGCANTERITYPYPPTQYRASRNDLWSD